MRVLERFFAEEDTAGDECMGCVLLLGEAIRFTVGEVPPSAEEEAAAAAADTTPPNQLRDEDCAPAARLGRPCRLLARAPSPRAP